MSPSTRRPRAAPAARPEPPPRTRCPEPGARTRVAIVGAGFIADFHLEALRARPEVELVAVCDPDFMKAQRAAERHRVPLAVGSVAELVEHRIDVAHVLVPPDRHADVARVLLEAGIGVFLEKPMATRSSEVRELAGLAAERGLALAVNHNAIFHPAFRRLLATLRGGAIGRLDHVQVTLHVPLRQLDAGDTSHWMFREPQNILLEQATHPFSQLVELVGRVESLEATLLSTRELQPGRPFHDRWSLAARAEHGTAEVSLAFGTSFTKSSVVALGSDGAIEADLFHDLVTLERKTAWLEFWNSFLAGWRRGGQLRRRSLGNLLRYARQTLGLGEREDAFFVAMRDSIHAFHDAFRHGERPPTDAAHGLAVMEWCEAAAAAAGLAKRARAKKGASFPEEPPPARAGEVCVLGATGFIGRRTLAALAERNLPVTAVVRRRHGLPPEIADGAASGATRLADADLRDPAALAEAVRGARVVLHLATGGGDTWEEVERAMVQGTRAVAEACIEHGVERLIYVSSTAALYLGRDAGAVVGDDVGPDPRPRARALYARGKIAAEAELARLAKRGLRTTIVRPAVVVGRGAPLQHSGLGLWVRDNHCVGWGLGGTPLPLVLVDDVADALARLAAFEGDELDGRALNLAARTGLSAREVVRAFRDATGRDFHFHPRPLWISQAMEIGKWIVKRVGGRRDAAFPSWRDLKSRQLRPRLSCERARDVLGWKPCDDGAELLRRLLRP